MSGLVINRLHTHERQDVFDTVEWERRTATIAGTDGTVVFEQKDVEIPKPWSQLATNVVVSKYFRGSLNSPNRETSVRQVIGRVVDTITRWGLQDGYFSSPENAQPFADELKYLLLHQYGSFNSPVWFNLGVPGTQQQASACFIQRVEDDLKSITDLLAQEALLFKYGSGSGANMSRLRSNKERLALGGEASGPVSFIKALDAFGGAMKSGGTCISPEQPVYTRLGPVMIKDLLYTSFEVLSYHPPTNSMEWKRARVWNAGRKLMCRITTRSSKYEVSRDHPIKLDSGEFVPADSLRVGADLFTSTAFPTPEDNYRGTHTTPQRVLSIDLLPESEVYDLEVECSTEDDKSPDSGHNFLITDIDQRNPTKTGIVVSNTRRAAIMRILDATHPDILEFINCKKDAELKAHALIDAGYDGGFNVHNGAYDSVPFQNANHSVRVSDEFMKAAISPTAKGEMYCTKYVTKPEVDCEELSAREVLQQIAEATWVCGDPGMQYDDTINTWHTCLNTDRIYGSNPCSEFVFLDDTACNLASLNLMKFRHKDGSFDAPTYIHATEVFITAMEIIVGNADYPTKKIEKNSHDFRPLGLGYCNLGSLLMVRGLAYDSDEGRRLCSVLTSILTGAAYRQSARLARQVGPFSGFAHNEEPMMRVMCQHFEATQGIDTAFDEDIEYLHSEAMKVWREAIALGETHGYRNAQAVTIAPTGTIAFMMDSQTTGIEPDIALVKFKRLVGGGSLKLVNQNVAEALTFLGYYPDKVNSIIDYIAENGTIEGSGILEDHLSVFDCAFKPMNGVRSIHHEGHIKMMAAAQPFVSGAISKTVNLPTECTVEDIFNAYVMSWKLGLKAVAVYRDGSKRTQPLSTTDSTLKKAAAIAPDLSQKDGAETQNPTFKLTLGSAFTVVHEPTATPAAPYRRQLPDERTALTHKFTVAGQKGYLTVGLYEDGSPGELFIQMSKQGSTMSGLMDSFAIAVSISLQYGVPLAVLIDKFKHTRFEPAGFTGNREIQRATSLMDYIFRWLELKFQSTGQLHSAQPKAFVAAEAEPTAVGAMTETVASTPSVGQLDAPPCGNCGSIMVRAGSCYKCNNCGNTSGCG